MSAPAAQPSARDAPIGGQAVLEGVMMRGISTWALAVRSPVLESPRPTLGAIEVSSFPLGSPLSRRRWVRRLPLVRGVVALVESLVIGYRALALSAAAQLPEEERGEMSAGLWFATIAVALVFAIGLFFVVPVLLTNIVRHGLGSSVLFWIVEGFVRTAIFLAYLVMLSRMRDLRRVLEYHGAEHKAISCHEAGLPLTALNAQRMPRLHPRCGTSFLLIVMIVAIFVFAPIGLPAWYWLVVTRILGVPVIAGLSFEIIRLAGRHRRRRWVRVFMWPGMQLQKLTTREPDLDQLDVAIASLEAVLAVEAPGSTDADQLVGLEVVA